MRPDLLNPLFAGAIGLKGVGDKLDRVMAPLLRPSFEEGAGNTRIVDLLLHMPSGIIDRRTQAPINRLPPSGIVTVKVTIGQHRPPPRHNRRVPYRVECFDDTGSLTLVFFHAHGDYLARMLPQGETRYISGRIEYYAGMPQITHPDHMVSEAQFRTMPLLEPVYPLTAGLSGKVLARAIHQSIERLPDLPEWQDRAWLEEQHFSSFKQTLTAIHLPASPADIDINGPARRRIAYDELLANQLALALVRRHMRQEKGRQLRPAGDLRARIIASLPYSLTGSQQQAISEILSDMASPHRMLRLLQGDVGAGKTIVALAALATAVEAGAQGALLAPTEILARQHLGVLCAICQPHGITVDLLTGREKGKQREAILARLANGETDILIGTHALFQRGVEFARLALIVIDEQHRFGVHQRLAMQSKATGKPDVLVMTATPIPRTLTLTLYGDMDVSRLTEKPAGRQPVDTRVMPLERLDQVTAGLKRAIAKGARAYWVCPLVEDSELSDRSAATARFKYLEEHLPGRVGLVHGRMKGAEKDAVMEKFRTGEISVLVATTVIEVGVDVPEATIMVIENAEQFGLAQLHQLRGRIGRGGQSSSCLLLYKGHLGETAHARLETMRETEDGFVIAEKDLQLRGSGDVMGTRQSGMTGFRLADPFEHSDLLAAAHDDARLILSTDPMLSSERGKALKVLLYLFERDAAIRFLTAG